MPSRYDITRRIRAAVDRSDDPHLLIDMVREELEDHIQRIEVLEKDVQSLKNSDRNQWTKTGIWAVVKERLDSEAIVWLRWAARVFLGVLITGAAGGVVWIFKQAIAK